MKDKSPIIVNVSNMNDIEELKKNKNAKYINLDISNPNLEVIYYLIENGQNYSYSDRIDDKNGYIYVPYDIFKTSELLILEIINNINPNLSELEISRYIYITLGKLVGYDINILPDKNETFNLEAINTINNIWGCLNKLKGTNESFAKLYLYLCRIMNIDCNIITVSKMGYLKNVLNINNSKIMTDITQDIPFIQVGFKTRYFLGYNDDKKLDQKIGYIKDDYSENKIEQVLKSANYDNNNIIKEILVKTQNIIHANEVKPIELGLVYEIIFNKYCPNYNISINNLFVNNIHNQKEHFILISHDNKHYSYNYSHSSFVEIAHDEIIKSIEDNKIGVYLNEQIPDINKTTRKAI